MKIREDLAGLYSQITTSSAISPALKLCAISPFALLFAILAPPELRMPMFLLGAAPIIFVILQVLWFTFVDADRLQNESHVEKKMLLQRFGWKEGGETREVAIEADAERINNPLLQEDK